MAEQNNVPNTVEGALIASGLGVDLSDEELWQLVALAVGLEFKKGARILEEGSKSRDIYIVKEGQVSVMMDITLVQKLEERVARLNDNDIFGEFAFVSGSARSASIQAETKLSLLQFKYDDLHLLFLKNPLIGYKIMRNIAVIVTRRVTEQHKLVRKLLFCD